MELQVPTGYTVATEEQLASLETKGQASGIVLPKGTTIEVGQLVCADFDAKDENGKTVRKTAFFFLCSVNGSTTPTVISFRTFNPYPKERQKHMMQTAFMLEVFNAPTDRARVDVIKNRKLRVKELQECEYKPHGSQEYKKKFFMVLEDDK